MPMDLVPESGPTLPDDSPNEEPCKDVTVQTDLTMADLQAMQEENEKLTCSLHSVEQQKQHLSTASQALDTDNQRLTNELRLLAAEKEKLEVTEASLQQDNGKVFFYTGIANFALLSALFQLVEVAVKHTPQNGLAKFQEFVVFLMKLKWNFPLQDLAYRGFDIADSVGLYCATLCIPAFTKGKSQLSALEVASTRKLANVRIHVERVIGLVRNKFIIMKAVQPIDFVTCKPGDKYTALDKIVTVCCALANLCPSVVPLNQSDDL
ncbi:hypothetical protein MTO96_006159 [Rhipicephalus appendiculatus]